MAEMIPVSGAQDLQQHLQDLSNDPEIPLNSKLFDDVELQLNETNTAPLIPQMLPLLASILQTYQHDPTTLVSLTIKLLKPVTFRQALSLASEESLLQLLHSPAPSANELALVIISKARTTAEHIRVLAGMRSVVAALITLWLASPSVRVGDLATSILATLLEKDCDRRRQAGAPRLEELTQQQLHIVAHPGLGQLWRGIFHDEEIYASIYRLCSLATAGDAHQKTLAQGRLLSLLPQLVILDFTTMTRSPFPAVEARYHVPADRCSLLYFAALVMVDKEDLIMYYTSTTFFRDLLVALSTVDVSASTLTYLIPFMREAVSKDEAVGHMMMALEQAETSPPELVELLQRLNNR